MAILKQAELGTPIADLLRQRGISEQRYYQWKMLYGDMEHSEARELRMLRKKPSSKLVADLSLDKMMLQDVSQKSSGARQEARDRELLDGQIWSWQSQDLSMCKATAVCVYFYRSCMDPWIEHAAEARRLGCR